MGPRPNLETESRATTKTRRSVAAALAGAAVLGAGCLGGGEDDTTPTPTAGSGGGGGGDGSQETRPATPEAGCGDQGGLVHESEVEGDAGRSALDAADNNGDGWACTFIDDEQEYLVDNGDEGTPVAIESS